MKLILCILCSLHLAACTTFFSEPDCSSSEGWPASMAYVELKNAGIFDAPVIAEKTQASRVAGLRLEENLFRQVHRVDFVDVHGETYQVLTVSDASEEECSMSEVTVYQLVDGER